MSLIYNSYSSRYYYKYGFTISNIYIFFSVYLDFVFKPNPRVIVIHNHYSDKIQDVLLLKTSIINATMNFSKIHIVCISTVII